HAQGSHRPGRVHSDFARAQHARAQEAREVAMKTLKNILYLGIKEIRSLVSDTVMIMFVLYAFTFSVYSQATGTSNEVRNASIAFADEDQSPLSKVLFNAFFPPRFQYPQLIHPSEVENAMHP